MSNILVPDVFHIIVIYRLKIYEKKPIPTTHKGYLLCKSTFLRDIFALLRTCHDYYYMLKEDKIRIIIQKIIPTFLRQRYGYYGHVFQYRDELYKLCDPLTTCQLVLPFVESDDVLPILAEITDIDPKELFEATKRTSTDIKYSHTNKQERAKLVNYVFNQHIEMLTNKSCKFMADDIRKWFTQSNKDAIRLVSILCPFTSLFTELFLFTINEGDKDLNMIEILTNKILVSEQEANELATYIMTTFPEQIRLPLFRILYETQYSAYCYMEITPRCFIKYYHQFKKSYYETQSLDIKSENFQRALIQQMQNTSFEYLLEKRGATGVDKKKLLDNCLNILCENHDILFVDKLLRSCTSSEYIISLLQSIMYDLMHIKQTESQYVIFKWIFDENLYNLTINESQINELINITVPNTSNNRNKILDVLLNNTTHVSDEQFISSFDSFVVTIESNKETNFKDDVFDPWLNSPRKTLLVNSRYRIRLSILADSLGNTKLVTQLIDILMPSWDQLLGYTDDTIMNIFKQGWPFRDLVTEEFITKIYSANRHQSAYFLATNPECRFRILYHIHLEMSTKMGYYDIVSWLLEHESQSRNYLQVLFDTAFDKGDTAWTEHLIQMLQ